MKVGPGSGLAAVTPTCGRVTRTPGPRFVSKMLMVRMCRKAVMKISGISPPLSGNMPQMVRLPAVLRRAMVLR